MPCRRSRPLSKHPSATASALVWPDDPHLLQLLHKTRCRGNPMRSWRCKSEVEICDLVRTNESACSRSASLSVTKSDSSAQGASAGLLRSNS